MNHSMRRIHFVAVGVEDFHVAVAVAQVMLRDAPERIARLDLVGLCCRSLSLIFVNRDVRREVAVIGVGFFDLIPDFVLGIFGRDDGDDYQLAILHMKILDASAFLIERVEGVLVLRFELIELIHIFLGLGDASAEHLIEDSHRLILLTRLRADGLPKTSARAPEVLVNGAALIILETSTSANVPHRLTVVNNCFAVTSQKEETRMRKIYAISLLLLVMTIANLACSKSGAASLSQEDKYKLYYASFMTNDKETMKDVIKRAGIGNGDSSIPDHEFYISFIDWMKTDAGVSLCKAFTRPMMRAII
jgi:hypothetical protein